jgi:Uncharacterized protein conserved in bacteria
MAEKTRSSTMSRFLRTVALLVDLAAVCALVLTAYAGVVSPLSHSAWWGVLPLGFPFAFWGVTALLLLQLLWHRRGAVVCALGMLLCAGPVLAYFPVNIGGKKAPEGKETFTMMSFNAHQFLPPDSVPWAYPIPNPSIEYVLQADVDIVCLQEASYIISRTSQLMSGEQIRRMHEQYPYIIGSDEICLMSKFPTEAIHLDVNDKSFPGGWAACYRVTLPGGRNITIFDVHLHSMRLRSDDREVWNNITELKREDITQVRTHLLDKLASAAVGRAKDVLQLQRYIRLYGGPDVIVCGDFNDVSGCHAIRSLADSGFRSVWPETGLGPLITFNSDRMYFGIDHILYRGDLHPLSMHRGGLRSSDHYPLIATFYVDK